MFVNIDVLILIYKLFSPVNSNDASRGSHLIIMSNQTLINKNKNTANIIAIGLAY